jgi:hypothetical protein
MQRLRYLIAGIGLTPFLYFAANAQAFTDEDKKKALETVQATKEAYWVCLSSETQRMLGTAIVAQDFKLYLMGSCLAEKQSFRVPLVDYMAMIYPELPASQHFAEFAYVADQAVDASVRNFIEQKLSK